MSERKVERNVWVHYKDGHEELYENVDAVSAFKTPSGVDFLLITFYGNATTDNYREGRDDTTKINIPLASIRKYETVDDFEENLRG